jgi:pyruvate formate lyase activating enzyme
LSAVLFCQGCPWRCRYCHNPHLQPFDAGLWEWSAVEAFLESRRGLLDAVVFSGGEPTAQHALEGAIRAVRRLGFQVGLHTAGIFPARLRRVLPLVSWVGLDLKAPFDARYDAITRKPASWRAARTALEEVLAAGVPYELRTTVHPALLDEAAREALACELTRRGTAPTRWQEFRPQGCADAALTGETPQA